MRGWLSQDGMLDRIAIGLSGLCVVHCAGTALLIALLSAGGALLNPLIHEIGLALAIGIGVVALARGMMVHGRVLPCAIGMLGILLMAAALGMTHERGEALFTILGVATLALGHQLNRRAVG